MFELLTESQTTSFDATLPHWYQPGVTYFVTFRTV